MKILVLGLGNELLADDGVGVLAAQRLRCTLDGQADVVASSLSGMALLELLVGYDKAILIDAVQTGTAPAGTIRTLTPNDLSRVIAPSPHYAGLPEMFSVAAQLELEFPQEIVIYAVEVADAYTLGGGVSPGVAAALDTLVNRVRTQISDWSTEAGHA